jgi:hypothetical protein
MGVTGGAVLGFLVGLLVAGAVAFALARTLLRVTGAQHAGELARLVWSGLMPGGHRDGVAVQRALARLLKDTYSVMASGRRVSASAIDVHVSPEDYRSIVASIGSDAAVADLVEFYVSYARENQWQIADDPVITLHRDISLRPRQAYAQRTIATRRPDQAEATADLRASDLAVPDDGVVRDGTAVPDDEVPRPDGGVPHDEARDRPVVPQKPPAPAAAATEQLADLTRPYGAATTEVLGPGDLVVVHGTNVRMVPRERGRALVGRAREADIVIDRPGVSRQHVTFELRPDGWYVVPHTAKNGTLLDGTAVEEPTRLPSESTLGLGRGVRLRLTVEPAAR